SPFYRRGRTLRLSHASDTQHHVISKGRQFIQIASALGLHFHLADLRETMLKRAKEGRIDRELLLLSHALPHSIAQLFSGEWIRGAVQLDRSMEGFKQGEVTQISEEYAATRG